MRCRRSVVTGGVITARSRRGSEIATALIEECLVLAGEGAERALYALMMRLERAVCCSSACLASSSDFCMFCAVSVMPT